MALLKEDDSFTHVIAIDFGTGASGYTVAHSASPSLPNFPIRKEKSESRFSIPVTAVTIRRPLLPYYSMRIRFFWTSESTQFKNMPRLSKMEDLLTSSRMYL